MKLPQVRGLTTDTISEVLKEPLASHQRNFDFYHAMRMMQEPATVSSFTNWTNVRLGQQKKPFVLDADTQFPVALGGERSGLFSLHVIPRFKVRIFRNDTTIPYGPNGDESLPVRTPSNMPTLAVYWGVKNLWKQGEGYSQFFCLKAFHHSNGQDGAEIEPSGDPVAERVNIYNGNYGEQVVFEGITGGRIVLGRSTHIPAVQKAKQKVVDQKRDGKTIMIPMAEQHCFFWQLGYEWHPRVASSQVLLPYSLLGRHRLNGQFNWHWSLERWELVRENENKWCMLSPGARFERFRTTLNFNYVLDRNYQRGPSLGELERVRPFELKRRLNLWMTTYWVLPDIQFTALFLRGGYWGSDNYNIYLNQSMWQLQFGLAFGFFDHPSISAR
ncbi:MAG: hypothetical protein AAFQ68_03160 [Bacteroidota bacterium]